MIDTDLNVHRVYDYYRLVDSNDVAGLVDLFAPDAIYHRPGYPPLIGHYELTAFYLRDRIIVSGRHTVMSVVAAGGGVAVQGSFTGLLRDGTTTSLRFADFFTVSATGHFTRRDTYFFAALA